MRIFKIIIISLLSLVNAFLLYQCIGYLILGATGPKIVGDRPTTFTGMYMMSITYFLILAVVLTITIFIIKRLKRK